MLDFFAFVFLIAGLLMLTGTGTTKNISLLAIQSLALSIIAFYMGFAGGAVNWHMVLIGGLTFTVKVIVLPWILYKLVEKIAAARVVKLSIGLGLSSLVGVLLVGLTYAYVVPVLLNEVHVGGQLLPVALSTVLLGCFFMTSRRSAISQLIGVIFMENGLFLCGIAVTGGMPLIIELGIFFDLLVGALVMGIMIFQIRDTFDTLDTKLLNKLKH